MRRHFGNPGRLDMATLHPAPAARFTGRLHALAATFAVMVILLGTAVLAAAIYSGAQHLALLRLAHGG